MGASEATLNLALLALPPFSIAIPVSPHLLCTLVGSAHPEHHVTETPSSWVFGTWNGKVGGGKGDVLCLQGQQRSLQTSAVRLGTVILCSSAWGLPGEHALMEQTLSLNQIPLCNSQMLPLMGMFPLQMHLEIDTATL